MDFVVDANVLFAALIKEGKTAELMLNENLHLFSPEFLLEEFFGHKSQILDKTKRSDREFQEIFDILKQVITIVPKEEFQNFISKAEEICPDPDDVPYFALALRLNCGLWSNERKLKEQDTIPVYSTEDLIKLFFV